MKLPGKHTIKIKDFGDDNEINELFLAFNYIGNKYSCATLSYIKDEMGSDATNWHVFEAIGEYLDVQSAMIEQHNAQNYSRELESTIARPSVG